MNSAKHILFLVPGFPADENDFMTVPPLQDFLIKLKSVYLSAHISVIAFQYPFTQNHYFWNDVKIYPLGGKGKIFRKLPTWLLANQTAKMIHKTLPITVIHSLWLGECAMIGNFLSKRFSCKHLCTLMGQDVKTSNKYLRWLKKTNTKLIAISKTQADEFFRLAKRRVDETIHWGVEDQLISNTVRDIDLLAVGSLIPLKNYSLLIKLIADVKKINPKINCKLAGDGPELGKLMRLTNKFGVSENIEFTGQTIRQEIFKLMRRSKIFVHTSLFEGAGYVFAEALVNGMNIISFNVGYAQEHPKWFIAKDEKDFIQIAKNLITTSMDYNPVNLFPLMETVERYAEIYGLI